MKTQMDKDTILFVFATGEGIAYNYAYLQAHATDLNLGDPSYVLYKMDDDRNTWIDFKKAIQNKSGSFKQRLAAAFNDPLFRITDLRLIPETQYTDANGYVWTISPFDGFYDMSFWLARTTFDLDKITYSFTGDSGNDLTVVFNEDITNAFISLNCFFADYDQLAFNTVVFRNIKQYLVQYQIMGDIPNAYNFKFDVFAWDDLSKSTPIYPTGRESDSFVMATPIEDNCIIVYNGAIYDYTLNYANKTLFTLNNVSSAAAANFRLDHIRVYQMQAISANVQARRYIVNGIANKFKNSVDFVLPIENSMILYNGVDQEFEVMSAYSIVYPTSLLSVTAVSNLSQVISLNFMKG
jgi:hypothetical protein